MSNFESWKTRIAGTLADLPTLDDMAETDEYVQSSEFNVSKTGVNAEVAAPKKDDAVPSHFGSILDDEEDEEGWDLPTVNHSKTSILQDVHSALSLNLMETSEFDAMPRKQNISVASSLSTQTKPEPPVPLLEKLYDSDAGSSYHSRNLSLLYDSDAASSHHSRSVSRPLLATDEDVRAPTKEWSLLDCNITAPTIAPAENDEMNIPDIMSNSVVKNEKEPKQQEFAPMLSVVAALMSEDDNADQNAKMTGGSKPSFMESFDDDSSSDANPRSRNDNSSSSYALSLESNPLNYYSDQNTDSDVEDDHIMGMIDYTKYDKDSEAHTTANNTKANSSKNSSLAATISTLNVPADTQHDDGAKKSQKPVWFDVFDDTQDNNDLPVNVDEMKNLVDIESGGSLPATSFSGNKNSTSVTEEFNLGWLRQMAAPKIQSVSKNLVSKWKEHQIGNRVKSVFKPESENPFTPSNSTAVYSRGKDSTRNNNTTTGVDTIHVGDEHASNTIDSTALMGQEEQEEWDRIRAASSQNIVVHFCNVILKFWDKYDNYMFIIFTFFMITWMYGHISKRSPR